MRLTNSIPYFQIPDAQPTEPLHLETYAADLVGNLSQTQSSTVSVEEPGSEEEFVNTPEGGNCSVGDPCGENAFPGSQKEAEAGASTTVPEDPNNNAGGFESSSKGSAAPAQAAPAGTAALRNCRGKFSNVVSNVYFKRGKYGTLYWDFFLTPAAIDALGPKVVTDMTHANVNGGPINPPYSPHDKVSDYDFHSSMRKYQGLAGFPSGAIKTGDTVTFVWVILSQDGSGEGAYRNITCTVPQPGVG